MKVYLACTVRGDRGGIEAGRRVASVLRRLGHHVLTLHLLEDNVEAAEAALSEADVFERDLAWLSSCDLLIAEASGSSYGVGFEVGFVLGRAPETGQRVLLLYDETRRGRISRLITGARNRACTTFGYTSLEELEGFIGDQLGT